MILQNKILTIQELITNITLKNFMNYTTITADELFLTNNIDAQYIIDNYFNGELRGKDVFHEKLLRLSLHSQYIQILFLQMLE